MSQVAKIETIILGSNDIFVAHPNCNPVGTTLFYFKVKCFIGVSLL
jgi:hypothetical protein